jgi:hypothetical protein
MSESYVPDRSEKGEDREDLSLEVCPEILFYFREHFFDSCGTLQYLAVRCGTKTYRTK